MGCMGIAWKVLVGLVLVLPMTGYVVGSLVAAADEPREHAPIIVQEQTKAPQTPRTSPSAKPTHKPEHDKNRHGDGHGSDDPTTEPPEIVTPSPSELFDDNGGLQDNSGKGSGGGGDDSGGSGSGHG